MGFEGFNSSKCPGMARHKRSKSFPDRRGPDEDKLDQSTEAAYRKNLDMECVNDSTNSKKKQSSNAEIQNSLRQEILQLEKRLQDQVSIRCALEKALGFRISCHDISHETTIPNPATELIKEIAVLELEVGRLEQYLLSLYRKAFDQQISSLSPSKRDEGLKSYLATPRRGQREFTGLDITTVREKLAPEAETQTPPDPKKEANGLSDEKHVDYGVEQSQLSLSQCSALANVSSAPIDVWGKAVRACHSQPLSVVEYSQNASSPVISLAEHLGTCNSDHTPETPNKLSQEMVKCMSDIYCRLADSPLANHCFSSPTSSLSSTSASSPKDRRDLWSPGLRKNSSFDARLDNPFHVEVLKDFSGPYSTTVEVKRIHTDGQKLSDIEHSLQNYRSLVSQLEEMDPRKMTHEEKLAFWVNVHNALVMHAFLAYGVPQNNSKRMFILLKAAYNVGGHVVSAVFIQNSILRCRMSRPGQWLRLLFSSKTKLKAGDERQTYAIERPEPLLHFALSCGSHSDPVVRIYTPKAIFQELEAAKGDYIRSTFAIQNDQKIILPKIVESFLKDSGLCPAGLMETIQRSIPDSLRKSIEKYQLGKSHKNIEWSPHNFTFRYLILKDLG